MNKETKYELLKLETLLSSLIRRVYPPPALSELSETVRTEAERIRIAILNEVLSIHEEKQVARYIKYHQVELTTLMELTNEAIGNSRPENLADISAKEALEEIQRTFGQLYRFIQDELSEFFDDSISTPTPEVEKIRTSFLIDLRRAESIMMESDLEPWLLNKVLDLPRRITNNSPERIPYQRISFARCLLKKIIRVGKEKSSEPWNDLIFDLALSVNYNSRHLVDYFAERIRENANASETISERIDYLSQILVRIRRSHRIGSIPYHSDRPSLADQLTEFVTEERNNSETMIRASGGMIESGESFKVHFEISVSQLAYLIRVLLERKIVLNSNLTELLTFLAHHSTTKKSESISYGSFRSKFYSVEAGTKEAVKEMLLSMVRHIERS